MPHAHTPNGKVLTVTNWRPPEPRTPAEVAELQRLRRRMIRAVDRLMAFLDAIDGDPDLEDGADDEDGGDDEFSLGSLDRMMDQRRWSEGFNGELEAGDEKEGDELDTREAADEDVYGEYDELCHGEAAGAPDEEYRERLRKRRGEKPKRRRPAPGICNVQELDGRAFVPGKAAS